MAIYSISDLERLCGIKAHTLRMWEKRYSILKPKRTPGNIRYYNEEDLKMVLNISLLNKNGYKISKIVKMDIEEISEIVASLSETSIHSKNGLDSLTLSMIDLDESRFDRLINNYVSQYGFEYTMTEIFFPSWTRSA